MGLIYKIEAIDRKILDQVICDRCDQHIPRTSEAQWNQCGEPHTIFHEATFKNFFRLEQQWGYFSRKDGEIHHAVLCESCYDVVFSGIKITVTSYF